MDRHIAQRYIESDRSKADYLIHNTNPDSARIVFGISRRRELHTARHALDARLALIGGLDNRPDCWGHWAVIDVAEGRVDYFDVGVVPPEPVKPRVLITAV